MPYSGKIYRSRDVARILELPYQTLNQWMIRTGFETQLAFVDDAKITAYDPGWRQFTIGDVFRLAVVKRLNALFSIEIQRGVQLVGELRDLFSLDGEYSAMYEGKNKKVTTSNPVFMAIGANDRITFSALPVGDSIVLDLAKLVRETRDRIAELEAEDRVEMGRRITIG